MTRKKTTLLLATTLLAAASTLPAATITWSTNASGDWLTGANWSGGVTPGASDLAVFNGNASATTFAIDFGGATNNGANNQIVGEIALTGSAARTIGAGTATSGTLTLQGVGGVVLASSSGFALTLASSVNSATGAMTVNLGNGAIDVSNSGSITISAAISGTNGLTKTGVGTGALVISGANTFTGATTLSGGATTLNYTAQNNGKLDAASALNFGGGSLTIAGNASAATTQTVSAANLLAGSGATTLTINKGAATVNATLNLNAITRAAGTTLNLVYGGTAGAGVASATTDNTNTNGILGGWATVGGVDWAANSTNAADGAILAYTGYTNDTWAAANNTLVNTNALTVTGGTTNSLKFGVAGARSLTLSGTNTISTGGILVSSTVGNNASTITGGTIRGSASGELIVNQFNTSNSLTIASVIANNTGATGLTKSGGGTLILSGTNTYTGATIINAGTLQVGAAGTTGTVGAAAITNNGTLSVNRTNAITLANAISGTGVFTQAGTGATTLSGANTFTGAINANAGTLVFANAGALSGTARNVTVAAAGVVAFDYSTTLQTILTTRVVNTSAGTVALTANNTLSENLDFSASGANLTAAFLGATGAITYSGTLTQNGTAYRLGGGGGTLTFAGVNQITGAGNNLIVGGNVVFNAAQDFGGTTTINSGGNLRVFSTSALTGYATAAKVTVASGGTLTVNAGAGGGDWTESDIGSLVSTATFASGSALGVDTTGGSFAYSGILAGSYGLTKTGSNTLTLSGANTFSGATTVSAGSVNLSNSLALQNSTLTLNAGSSAVFDASVSSHAFTVGALAGAANLALADNAGSPNAVALTAGGNNASTTYSGILSGAGSLNKTGTGTLILTGANTFAGPTTVTAGILQFGNATGTATVNVGLGAGVTVKSGATLDFTLLHANTTQTATYNIGSGAVTLESGGTLRFRASTGSDIHNLAAAIGVSGNTTINNNGGSYDNDINLTGKLSGTGTLSYLSSSNSGSASLTQRTLTLNNATTDFAGDWYVDYTAASTDDFLELSSASANALGTGVVTLNTRAILTAAVATGLDSLSGVTLNTATSTLNIGNNAWTNTNATLTVTAGTVNMGNGTSQIGTLNGAAAGIIQANSGTSATLQAYAGTYAGLLSNGTGTFALTKAGSGTLTISGANTYTGGTVVNAGTLLLTNVSGSALGATGTVAVNGGILGGSGSYAAGLTTVASGATLQGGSGAASGTLTVSGNVTLASGSIIQLALGSAGAHSSLALTGTTIFDAAQKFTFLDLGAAAGTYSGLITGLTADPTTTGGWTITNGGWTGAFTYNAGSIDLVVTAVPEPSTYGLIGAGVLAGVAMVRRRRKVSGLVA